MLESALWTLLHDAFRDQHTSSFSTLAAQLDEGALGHLPIGQLKAIVPDVPVSVWRAFSQRREARDVVEERQSQLAEAGITLLRRGTGSYPTILETLYDPPGLLYHRGHPLPDQITIAMVGSRKATHYGLEVAYTLAADLSKANCTVVSGLARGIDGRAHSGALTGEGGTVAVLGSGIDRIYPPEHKTLYREIVAHPAGAVLSEFPLGAVPKPYRFPRRNRIIAGLSKGVLVVEAAEKSGALITAREALENGRDVYAVPGLITSAMSKGCHALIQDGAKCITCAGDVLEEFDQLRLFDDPRKPVAPPLNAEEKIVYHALSAVPRPLEDVVLQTGLPVDQVIGILSLLELNGQVEQLVGRQYKIL